MSLLKRILINDYAGHPFQVQLSRELARRGHDVLHTYCASVQTPHGSLTPLKSDPVNFNVKPLYLQAEFNKYGLLSRWNQEKELGELLISSAREFSPQVVMSANTPLRAQHALLCYCKSVQVKFVSWVQDLLGIGIQKVLRKKIPLIGSWLGLYFVHLERSVLKNSDEVVIITDDFRPFVPQKSNGSPRVCVIENWAPLSEVKPQPKVNSWSKEHKLSDKICLLYSGTLGMKHNPELLFHLARHFKENPEVRIVVVTEGPGAAYLKDKKTSHNLNNLLVMDFQPFIKLQDVLASADVLLALLEEDAGEFAVPSKVLTYLCAERPLLLAVPLQNLAARIVSENNAGLVVAPSDSDNFLHAAQQLVADSRLRIQYAANGRHYAEQTFDIQAITDRFEKIINRW